MDQGRIVREGTIAALTQLRQDRYAVRVREGISAFEEKLREAGCLTEIAGDGKVEVRLPAGKAPADVFRLARSWGFQVRDVVPVRHRLEDVFMEALANAKSAEKG